VIGESQAGNNRGDTKVVNAPINLFGRASEATENGASRFERSKISALARLACIFPADPSAEINMIPVDRVAEGMVAVLTRPEAVGERVHLATDNRIKSVQIRDIVNEEVGAKVTLAEPTIHRTVTLPLPPAVKALVDQGLELGDANDRVFSTVNSKQQGGAFGLLTNGIYTREGVYTQALVIALVPFVNELYP